METQIETKSSPAYNKKDWKVWWRLTRPHTLTAAFVPVTHWNSDRNESLYSTFDLRLFITMLIASILIQIATNLFNEYYDYKRGLDNEESVGIGGGIVRDGLKPKTIMQLALGLYGDFSFNRNIYLYE